MHALMYVYVQVCASLQKCMLAFVFKRESVHEGMHVCVVVWVHMSQDVQLCMLRFVDSLMPVHVDDMWCVCICLLSPPF